MFGIATRHRRQTARGLIALLLGFWALTAAAPCVMAAIACHDMSATCTHPGDVTTPTAHDSNCETLQAADCQTRDAGWLTGSTGLPDFTALPPQAVLSSQAVFTPFRNTLPDAERFVLRFSTRPLYLQHHAFLT
ncbi:MAG: hypothetical protein OEV31_07515 [Gammaproteobacteria bacterium]|nr:hypothetical protein [Gammaproteobacteria bacterium]